MKSGTYQVSFNVDLANCEDADAALEALKRTVGRMIAKDEFPEVDFELVEEFDIEYETEEDEIQELNF